MENIFVTQAMVPPGRWLQAFPKAIIVSELPEKIGDDAVVWLHNLMPAQMLAQRTGLKLIVMNDEPNDDTGLMALSQGAAGYCNSHGSPELLHTIESVVRNNGLWVGETLLGRLIGGISARARVPAPEQSKHPSWASLTAREQDVAMRVARGESNKEIARQLNLAERTIKAHLTSVFEKLGVRDRLQLALVLMAPEA